jgi:hypothetical protein
MLARHQGDLQANHQLQLKQITQLTVFVLPSSRRTANSIMKPYAHEYVHDHLHLHEH